MDRKIRCLHIRGVSGAVRLFFSCLLLAGLAARFVPAARAAEWVTSTLDDAGDYSSLALDSNGKAHASYFDGGDLKYATNASGAWVVSTLDSPGTGGGLTYASSIAVDGNGKVHIAYDGTQQLKYATNASGAWVITTLDNPGYDVGDDLSLALDSNNKVHISYLDRNGGSLKYATDLTGSWTLSNLGSGGYVTSITVDGNDKVHIVHFRAGNQLTYTTNASGSWVSTVIGVNGGYFASVKTDSANKVHVSYYASGAVNYMTNASGAWVNTVIDNAVGIAGNSSLVLDSLGGVHISYCNYNDNDLQYATNASGAWLNSIADQEGNVGYFSSLAIDGQDLLYVTYTDRTNGKVKFAYTLAGEEEEESDNLCFIATAAFGSPLAGQVALLRRFRDHCLLTNRPGAAFVSWYYRKGPLAARYIAPRPLARAAVRLVLYPLIAFSFLALNGWLLPGLILLAAVGAWLFWVQERRRTPAVL